MKAASSAVCRLRAMADTLAPQEAPHAHDHTGFWAGMSACEHFVHLYEDDESLLRLLERFVGDGLRAGEAAVVIATPEHLAYLERRLTAEGLDLVAARWQGQYLPMDARATLRQFMVSTGPDETLFHEVIGDVLARARRNGRRVRAFGEMVSLLWDDDLPEPTIQLERLWEAFCEREQLPLFCAYPKAAFDEASADALFDICQAHTRLIA